LIIEPLKDPGTDRDDYHPATWDKALRMEWRH